MKNTVFTGLIAATAIAVAGGAVYARGGHHGAPIDFETLDSNSDGQITKEEMQARGAARMASADTDGDGFLTKEELEAAGAERARAFASRMIERLDANADGKLSAEEMQKPDRAERAERRFDRVDTDGNGTISEAEFDAARANMKGHRKERAPAE
ncbi:EF-hand domain-containing protein [uncultured Roseobacter sp.]|uniref:EF-hand domain-containing protein n=1 Tax=uncultured Roseobacter sp. TaxID=114847 RepID=UPI00261C001C|nr:EF-hand domain-containing protein [uncultured Roseobacter sp.]